MKKIIILLFAFIITYSLQAQLTLKDYEFKNDFRVSVFSFFNSTFDVSYERLISTNKSLVLRTSIKWRDNGYDKEIGGMGEFQYRYYIVKRELSKNYPFNFGLYAAPYVFYKNLEDNNADIYYRDEVFNSQTGQYDFVEYNVDEVTYNTFGAGMYWGVKALVYEKITFDLSVGGGLKIAEQDADLPQYYSWGVFDEGYSGIVPRGNLTIGFIF